MKTDMIFTTTIFVDIVVFFTFFQNVKLPNRKG